MYDFDYDEEAPDIEAIHEGMAWGLIMFIVVCGVAAGLFLWALYVLVHGG
jgi:hypothetical protein